MTGGLTSVVRRFTGDDVVRVAVGVLVLAIAGLKTHRLATEPVFGGDRQTPGGFAQNDGGQTRFRV